MPIPISWSKLESSCKFYLASGKHIRNSLSTDISSDDNVILTAAVAGCYCLCRCQGDRLCSTNKFLGSCFYARYFWRIISLLLTREVH